MRSLQKPKQKTGNHRAENGCTSDENQRKREHTLNDFEPRSLIGVSLGGGVDSSYLYFSLSLPFCVTICIKVAKKYMPQITIAENRVWTSAEKGKCAPNRKMTYYIGWNENLAFWTSDIDVVWIT